MEQATSRRREPFFTHDPAFYKTFFRMLIVVALQNLVAYSVNMADNIMLGSYAQEALSGAAAVNQIFFMIQSYAMSVGTGLVVLAAQYWGQKRVDPIRTLTGIALRLGLISSVVIVGVCILFAQPLLSIFTPTQAIIDQGKAYLSIVQWSFVLFILSTILTSALRSIGTVNISFYISAVSLVINVAINYTLIFGRFGFPEMGIRGAAVGTLIARAVELGIVVVYLLKVERKVCFCRRGLFVTDRSLRRDFARVLLPVAFSHMLWAVSVPLQTAILGHLSDDAMAANSVATTFYQYLKVIVVAMASTAAVLIGNAIGRGDMARVRSEARTISIVDIGLGLVLGLALLVLRGPLLSTYKLSDNAIILASHMIIIMSVVMLGMSYQMPLLSVFQSGGDVKFTLALNLISVWVIVMPLSLAAAFWWKWPVEAVVIVLQSDQIFKGLPATLRLYSYKWIKKLTQPE